MGEYGPLERKIVGSGSHRYEFIPSWGRFPQGIRNNGIAIDAMGRVFICTLGNGQQPLIYFVDKDGENPRSWGTGAATHAHGLNIVDEALYVCDKNASVCLKYTLDGKILLMLGRHGVHSDTGCLRMGDPVPHAAGPFNHPDDFVAAPWGDIYAADGTHNARVHRFDSDGKLIQSWGNWGKAPGQFDGPHAVFPTADGKLYVCDRQNHRVQVFSRDGSVLAVWDKDLRFPCKVVATPDGHFAVGEDGGNPVMRAHTIARAEPATRPEGLRILDKDGDLVCHLDVGKTHQMAIDADGNIFTATHTAVNKLVRLS